MRTHQRSWRINGWALRLCVAALLGTMPGILARAAEPAPAAKPATPSTAPEWLRKQLQDQIRDALGAEIRSGQMTLDGPDAIVLRQVVLVPYRSFGWAERANEPAGGPARSSTRLTIAEARLVLSRVPAPGQALAIEDLTLDHPELSGTPPASEAPGAGGPGVQAGVSHNAKPTDGTNDLAARHQLHTGFDHLSVALQTLPPTASFVSLKRFLPLRHLVIRGGQITSPDGVCGLDLQTLADPNGEWRFGLTLSSPAATGAQTCVQTQGYCNPDQGTINMTGVKYLRVGADGTTSELNVGAIRLRLLLERGPADAGVPKPRVDTTEIDGLPSQYLPATPNQ